MSRNLSLNHSLNLGDINIGAKVTHLETKFVFHKLANIGADPDQDDNSGS